MFEPSIVKYSEQVHMARMHELVSASPPYERVPNILLYTFNNLFSSPELLGSKGELIVYPWSGVHRTSSVVRPSSTMIKHLLGNCLADQAKFYVEPP